MIYTWIVLPQGHTNSPTYFSHILKADPVDVVSPCISALLQCIELLLCAPSDQAFLTLSTYYIIQI